MVYTFMKPSKNIFRGKNNTYPELTFPVPAPLTDNAGVQYKVWSLSLFLSFSMNLEVLQTWCEPALTTYFVVETDIIPLQTSMK